MPLTQTLHDKLTAKVGPLPAWGWGVAIIGGYAVFRLFRRGGSSSSGSGIYDLGAGGSGGVLPDGAGAGSGGGGGVTTPTPQPTPVPVPVGIPDSPQGLPLPLPSPVPVTASPVPQVPQSAPAGQVLTFSIPGGGGIDTLYNPSAIFLAGTSTNPPDLRAPSADTIGLLNQYLYAYRNAGNLPSDAWSRFRDRAQVEAQITQLTAQVLASGGQYYGGYTLNSSDIALARQINGGDANKYALTPQFLSALQTGQATLAQSLGVENLPLVGASPSVPSVDQTSRPTDPHGGITQQDLTTLQGYIARITAVPAAKRTTAQNTELATYQTRLADYQRRYNGG